MTGCAEWSSFGTMPAHWAPWRKLLFEHMQRLYVIRNVASLDATDFEKQSILPSAIGSALDEIRSLESLRPYLQHRHDCEKCPIEIEGVLFGEALPPHECTCGLDAALAATPEPR